VDGHGHTPVSFDEQVPDSGWITQVLDALAGLLERRDVPIGDIEWLKRRCEDTLRFSGELRESSLEQLISDVGAFDQEFPGRLPQSVRAHRTR